MESISEYERNVGSINGTEFISSGKKIYGC